jgi:hypothetical protein
MRCWILSSILCLLMAAMGRSDATNQEKLTANLVDRVVLSDFRQRNPQATNITVFLQTRITSRYDLVLVCATEYPPNRSRPDRLFLRPTDLFGVYLRQLDGIPQMHSLTVEKAGGDGAELQVVRWSSTELLIRRFDPLGRSLTSLELFFDSAVPRILTRVEYEPFRVTRIIDQGGLPHFIAGDMKQTLVLRPSDDAAGFAIETAEEAKSLLASLDFSEWTTPGESFRFVMPVRHPTRRFGPGGSFLLKEEDLKADSRQYDHITETTAEGVRSFVLPQSTWDEFEKLRPQRGRDGYRRNDSRIKEEIGPNQVVGNRLWFGKGFYDAEGITGIGGFGYFDCEARRFVIYSPPEILNWSVTSILVAGNNVWMAASAAGEYAFLPHGLLQWEIAEQRVHSYGFEEVVHAMTQYRNDLYLATDEGIAILTKQGFRRYLIAMTRDGRHRIILR